MYQTNCSGMLCIVLDLDGTLIRSSTEQDSRFESFPILDATLWVHIRPHARELLRYLVARNNVTVCIWTAGVQQYAEDVVHGLCNAFLINGDTLHVFSRTDALPASVKNATVYVKDLCHVQERLPFVTDTLLVDDDPVHQCIPSNIGRIIQIDPFFCDPNDNVLIYIRIQIEIFLRGKEMNTPVIHPVAVRHRPLFLSSI